MSHEKPTEAPNPVVYGYDEGMPGGDEHTVFMGIKKPDGTYHALVSLTGEDARLFDEAWNSRQASPQQAPVRPYDEKNLEEALEEEKRSHDKTIDQRDHAEDMADKLAEAIAEHFEIDIGEHSNANCPWTNALNAIADQPPAHSPVNTAQPTGLPEEHEKQKAHEAIRLAYTTMPNSHVQDLDSYVSKLEALLTQPVNTGPSAPAGMEKIAQFALKFIRQYCWGYDPDGGEVQDYAEQLGLIVKKTANEMNGDEWRDIDGVEEYGDTYYMPSPELEALAASHASAPSGRAEEVVTSLIKQANATHYWFDIKKAAAIIQRAIDAAVAQAHEYLVAARDDMRDCAEVIAREAPLGTFVETIAELRATADFLDQACRGSNVEPKYRAEITRMRDEVCAANKRADELREVLQYIHGVAGPFLSIEDNKMVTNALDQSQPANDNSIETSTVV